MPTLKPARRGAASPAPTRLGDGVTGLKRTLLGQRKGLLQRTSRLSLHSPLALNPKLIIGDEPLSALDVTIQAQVINLISARSSSTPTSKPCSRTRSTRTQRRGWRQCRSPARSILRRAAPSTLAAPMPRRGAGSTFRRCAKSNPATWSPVTYAKINPAVVRHRLLTIVNRFRSHHRPAWPSRRNNGEIFASFVYCGKVSEIRSHRLPLV